MSTSAISAHGVILKRGSNPIPEISSIGGPSYSRDTLDATSHDSTVKEYIGSLVDSGEVSFTFTYIVGNAEHEGLRDTDMLASTAASFSIQLPDTGTTTGSFSGWVTKWDLTANHDGKLEVSCSIKVTGSITWA